MNRHASLEIARFTGKQLFQGEDGAASCATRVEQGSLTGENLVDGVGLEPTTPALRTRCSPN